MFLFLVFVFSEVCGELIFFHSSLFPHFKPKGVQGDTDDYES